ncbi:MAG: hypothetical protein HDS16_07710 [Bacteroides sp.]|nr:hypothetical protein [Bacteroides sp.]
MQKHAKKVIPNFYGQNIIPFFNRTNNKYPILALCNIPESPTDATSSRKTNPMRIE